MLTITYFVHSITTDNERGLATGWLPGELAAEGIRRAHAVADQIHPGQFDAVFASDLHRAVQSAEIFFRGRVPLFLDWRLRECNYGSLDGTPAVNFKKNREAEYIDHPYPDGESYHDVELRMRSFINDTRRLYDGATIAVVAHQAPQLALDVITNGMSWHQAIDQDWRKSGAWQPGWDYRT